MSNFKEEEEYFDGLLIEGSPYEISQHISRILASGAYFQFVDGEVIEVIRAGKDEVIVFNNGTVIVPPPVEKVAEERALPEPEQPVFVKAVANAIVKKEEPAKEKTGFYGQPVTNPAEEAKLLPLDVFPAKVVETPVEVPKPQVQKPAAPKAVVAEKAPAKKVVNTPAKVEEKN